MKEQLPIDFDTATYDELKSYVLNELILDNREELYSILRGHILIEWSIETLITRKGRSVKNRGFAKKVDLAEKLGILPEKYIVAARELNNIRNAYAHQKSPQKLGLEQLVPLKIWVSKNDEDIYNIGCRTDQAVNVSIILLNACFLRLLSQP